MNKDQKVIQCDCHSEIMLIERESESTGFKGFSFAMYEYGMYNSKPSLWYRLKYALRHIWTGKIYTDYIIIDDKKAAEIADFIKERIKDDQDS